MFFLTRLGLQNRHFTRFSGVVRKPASSAEVSGPSACFSLSHSRVLTREEEEEGEQPAQKSSISFAKPKGPAQGSTPCRGLWPAPTARRPGSGFSPNPKSRAPGRRHHLARAGICQGKRGRPCRRPPERALNKTAPGRRSSVERDDPRQPGGVTRSASVVLTVRRASHLRGGGRRPQVLAQNQTRLTGSCRV